MENFVNYLYELITSPENMYLMILGGYFGWLISEGCKWLWRKLISKEKQS